MEFGAGEMRESEELGVKAEWYGKQGSAEHVLVVGEMNERNRSQEKSESGLPSRV
jgi:hypothetical protein